MKETNFARDCADCKHFSRGSCDFRDSLDSEFFSDLSLRTSVGKLPLPKEVITREIAIWNDENPRGELRLSRLPDERFLAILSSLFAGAATGVLGGEIAFVAADSKPLLAFCVGGISALAGGIVAPKLAAPREIVGERNAIIEFFDSQLLPRCAETHYAKTVAKVEKSAQKAEKIATRPQRKRQLARFFGFFDFASPNSAAPMADSANSSRDFSDSDSNSNSDFDSDLKLYSDLGLDLDLRLNPDTGKIDLRYLPMGVKYYFGLPLTEKEKQIMSANWSKNADEISPDSQSSEDSGISPNAPAKSAPIVEFLRAFYRAKNPTGNPKKSNYPQKISPISSTTNPQYSAQPQPPKTQNPAEILTAAPQIDKTFWQIGEDGKVSISPQFFEEIR